MIIDTVENAAYYYALHPCLTDAFAFLRSADLSTLVEGRNEIDGENLFVMLAAGEGGKHAAAPLEVHRRYIDIHYTIEGIEEIGWKALESCKQVQMEYDGDEDCSLFNDVPSFYSILPAGTFGIYFPQDVHGPMAGYGRVKKVVFKVAI